MFKKILAFFRRPEPTPAPTYTPANNPYEEYAKRPDWVVSSHGTYL